MMRHQGALFGAGSPIPLLPHIHPSLIGGAAPFSPLPPPPLHDFKRLPYHHGGLQPFLFPHALTPIVLPIPAHRNVIFKHKILRPSFLPYPLPIVRNGPLNKFKPNSLLNIKGQKSASYKTKSVEIKKEERESKLKCDTPSTSTDFVENSSKDAVGSTNIVSSTNIVNETKLSSTDSIVQSQGIPPEMTKPLFCELCEAKLNSPLQATSHYEGKNHAKKVRFYLERMREKNGEKLLTPLPNSGAKTEASSNKKDILEEEYCKLCDVAFTSVVQATQHHNGRNHQRRLRGENPLPKGFFNPTTRKWQRQPPSYFLSQFHKQRNRVTAKSAMQTMGMQRIKVGL